MPSRLSTGFKSSEKWFDMFDSFKQAIACPSTMLSSALLGSVPRKWHVTVSLETCNAGALHAMLPFGPDPPALQCPPSFLPGTYAGEDRHETQRLAGTSCEAWMLGGCQQCGAVHNSAVSRTAQSQKYVHEACRPGRCWLLPWCVCFRRVGTPSAESS